MLYKGTAVEDLSQLAHLLSFHLIPRQTPTNRSAAPSQVSGFFRIYLLDTYLLAVELTIRVRAK